MNRSVDLFSYLPNFVKEYREIKQIVIGSEPEFQKLEDEVGIIKNNQFILSCNEFGIKRFEKLLNIFAEPNESLNSRISRVLTRWNDDIPYTFKSLIEKLNIMCGENNYIIIPDFENYRLNLIVHLPLYGQVDEFEYMLSYMLPANIKVISNNELTFNITGKITVACATVETNHFIIENN